MFNILYLLADQVESLRQSVLPHLDYWKFG